MPKFQINYKNRLLSNVMRFVKFESFKHFHQLVTDCYH